jgi:hypothetical protein
MIYQDVEGDKAGSRLPYMQTPASFNPSPIYEERIKTAASTKLLGIKLTQMATTGLAAKEAKERRDKLEKEREITEIQQGLMPEESARRDNFDRSVFADQQLYLSDFAKRLDIASRSFNTANASEELQAWFDEDTAWLYDEIGDLDAVDNDLLNKIIDRESLPNAQQKLLIHKGYMDPKAAVRASQLRNVNNLRQQVKRIFATQQQKMLGVEIQAAVEKTKAKKQQLTALFIDGQDTGKHILTSVEQAQAVFRNNEALYDNDPILLSKVNAETSKMLPLMGDGYGEIVGSEIIQSVDIPASMKDFSGSVGKVQSQIYLAVTEFDAELRGLVDYNADNKNFEVFEIQRLAAEKAFVEKLAASVNVLSAQLPPNQITKYSNVSPQSRATGNQVSFGQAVFSGQKFIEDIGRFLSKESLQALSTARYGHRSITVGKVPTNAEAELTKSNQEGSHFDLWKTK